MNDPTEAYRRTSDAKPESCISASAYVDLRQAAAGRALGAARERAPLMIHVLLVIVAIIAAIRLVGGAAYLFFPGHVSAPSWWARMAAGNIALVIVLEMTAVFVVGLFGGFWPHFFECPR